MTTITIPAIYKNWVITPLKPIEKNPTNIFITLEYLNFEKPKKKDIEDMTLLEYINSDEYKNEESIYYTDAESFLSDLKKWI